MSDTYTYNPDAWHPAIAGLVAGSVAAIVAGVLSIILRSPDEIVANSLSVVLTSLALGLVAGLLWRRIRASSNAQRTFGYTMAGGFFVAMTAVTIADQTVLSSLVPYAAPLAGIIFITLGFLTPLFAGVTSPAWIAIIPVVIALAMGLGLFGRGNVASGELTLDNVTTTTIQSTAGSDSTTTAGDSAAEATTPQTGTVTLPGGLAQSYTISTGLSTYSVNETLRGLQTQGVGSTESITGTITNGTTATFIIDLVSFESDQNRRDDRVREWFQDFPLGKFETDSFILPSSVEVGDIVALDVTGAMTINNITGDATWKVEARLEPSGTLSVTGETFIVLSEFDVPVVDSNFIVMEDGATIEIAFSAAPGN